MYEIRIFPESLIKKSGRILRNTMRNVPIGIILLRIFKGYSRILPSRMISDPDTLRISHVYFMSMKSPIIPANL